MSLQTGQYVSSPYTYITWDVVTFCWQSQEVTSGTTNDVLLSEISVPYTYTVYHEALHFNRTMYAFKECNPAALMYSSRVN
jgi:hypothetical protein